MGSAGIDHSLVKSLPKSECFNRFVQKKVIFDKRKVCIMSQQKGKSSENLNDRYTANSSGLSMVGPIRFHLKEPGKVQ